MRRYAGTVVFACYAAGFTVVGVWAAVTGRWWATGVFLSVPLSVWCAVDCWRYVRYWDAVARQHAPLAQFVEQPDVMFAEQWIRGGQKDKVAPPFRDADDGGGT